MLTTINRDIIILFPKQPLMDWVNSIFPNEKQPCPKVLDHDQGNVYMIQECFNTDDAITYLEVNFKSFFENELFDWSTDEKNWPQNRTWELFEDFFHYSYQSVVVDTINEEIEKGEY